MRRPGVGSDEVEVEVGGRTVRLSTLDRVLFPAMGFTKGELIDYYVAVADVLLPHIARRPLTLHRFPEGVGGPHFYQTRCPPHPPWVRTQHMSVFRSGKDVYAPVIDDLASLVWAANLSTIELHPYLAFHDRLDVPAVVVFDLDPGPPAGLRDACAVALSLRGLLDDLGLRSFPKTSGGKGLHVYVPLNGDQPYAKTKAFARAVAALLTREHAEKVTDTMTRSERGGKVFVDWSQNDAGKSTVAPYSLRGLAPGPMVSMPLAWDEVEAGAEQPIPALGFRPGDVATRLARVGELFAPVLTLRQQVPQAL